MNNTDKILIGKGTNDTYIYPKMGNRHGLVAGATGTGKTVTLQNLAENFSNIGVPVFMADVKGDLGGISQPGGNNPKVEERLKMLGMKNHTYEGCPVVFWDIYGEKGHPVRATVSDMGPLLLSRLLELNDVQSSVLSLVFKIADDNGLLILDLKDLKAMLQHVGDNAKQYLTEYGNISSTTIGTIQRSLIALEEQGVDNFFGEPALEITDLMKTDSRGKGIVNILCADKLFQSPRAYSTFLLWLLSELFEELPEIGDVEKPRIVFFFDEAHLLFDDAPKALLDKIQQVVRLIRSKGVGVYFISQNPLDIPDVVLGQLGNRFQHALRAFTPRDQKAVESAAKTFRQNPKIDITKAIIELKVGEALVSTLEENGNPSVVQRVFIIPPKSQIGAISSSQQNMLIGKSIYKGKYDCIYDRESAYEKLKKKVEERAPEKVIAQPKEKEKKSSGRQRQSVGEAMMKSAGRAVAGQLGRQLVRGLLGSILGGKKF